MTLNQDSIQVVAGILRNNRKFLLTRRPAEKARAGLLEFPGGKIETNESSEQALFRELKEELDIEISSFQPLISYPFQYTDLKLHISFFEVKQWSGKIRPTEGQQLHWTDFHHPLPSDLSLGDHAAYQSLAFGRHYPITDNLTAEALIQQCLQWIAQGIQLFQIRSTITPTETQYVIEHVLPELSEGQQVMLNSRLVYPYLPQKVGIHLSSHDLANFKRSNKRCYAASCHNSQELQLAEQKKVNFVCLSPAQATKSHPGTPALGWSNFSKIVKPSRLPVFALGGLKLSDLNTACQHGATGIAGISCYK
ncbi:MAG: Nudix family hydrolase [bacterium]